MNPVKPESDNHELSEDNSQHFPKLEDAVYSATMDSTNLSQVVVAATKTEISSGPLPHPDLVKGYDDIIPNGAERIMQMAEKEQENRFQERKEIRDANKEIAMSKLKYVNRGQIMGFVLALIMLGLATLFVFTGHEGIAYFLFSIGMVSLVALFLQTFISPKHKSKE